MTNKNEINKRKILKNIIPILFILGIMCYEYFVFEFIFMKYLLIIVILCSSNNHQNYHLNGQNKTIAIIILIETNPIAILLFWSYIKCIITPPGFMPEDINDHFLDLEEIKERSKRNKIAIRDWFRGWNKKKKSFKSNTINYDNKELIENLDDVELGITLQNQSQIELDMINEIQRVSFCFKCNKIKFPRTHHCSQCNKCILRMDHHCPWIGNCVGLYNHKFFILFLFYGTISSIHIVFFIGIFYTFEIYPDFQKLLSDIDRNRIQIIGAFSLVFMIAIGLFYILQLKCIGRNLTTIEYQVDELNNNKKSPFSKGCYIENLKEIFGSDIKNWFLPIDPILKTDYHLYLTKIL